jgi:hypothetical protein
MKGGEISGNRIVGTRGASGGVQARGTFIMEGGTIYGRNAEGGKANDGPGSSSALNVPPPDLSPGATAKWGIGGTYTKGGVPQSGGTDIGTTHDTLIAVPAR